MRCSTTDGFHGRSNSTRRRQNSKLRPSPPLRSRPAGSAHRRSRKRATSVSRRAGDSSSWKTPVASCARGLSAVAQHLERLAVGDEDERLLVRVAASAAPATAATRARGSAASIASRLLPQLASRPARAPPSARRPTRARGGCDRSSAARATALRRRRRSRTAASTALPQLPALTAPSSGRSECRRAAAGRRCRRGASSWCTAAAACRDASRASKSTSSGKLLRPQQLQQPEEPVRVVLERRRAEQQHVAAERGDRRDRAPGRLAGMPGRTPQPLRLVHDEQIDAGAAPPARSARAARPASRARSTARRWTSNGLKPAPKSRATSARRGASSSVNTWWYLRHSSPSHCTVSASGATTRQRSICRVCTRRFRISAASIVLPRPTSSASSQRTGSRRSRAPRRGAGAGRAGRVRRGTSRGRRPRAVASRCRMSRRVRKSSTSSSSPAASRSSSDRSRAARRAPPRGTSASLLAASRSVVPPRGKWTTRTRPSMAVTRPVPSSGLKRWVRWSPTDQACTP